MLSEYKNQTFIIGLLFAQLFIFNSCTKKDTIDQTLFNDGWFYLFLESASQTSPIYATEEYDDSQWEKVSLPHTAHIEPLLVNNQWQGICWYRKSFEIQETQLNKKIFIELEAAMNKSVIWINGKQVEIQHGGYLPIIIDATSYIKKGKNLIAIELDNRDNPLTGPKPIKSLDFNMYGGLYRNVRLIIKDKIYISNANKANKTAGGGIFITTPIVTKEKAIVTIKVHIINENEQDAKIKIHNEIYFNNKMIASSNSKFQNIERGKDIHFIDSINITDPNLWSPTTPYLYKLITKVIKNDKVIDIEKKQFGIRHFEFRKGALYINGEKKYLRGVNRHQEYPFVGYALSDNAQYRDAKKIKDAGFDCIRLSHYPHAPSFMNACDELGLIVIDAILGWQYYNNDPIFIENCYQSARDLIRRDRNHPSVLAWEVSLNETDMPTKFMKDLQTIAHKELPGNQCFTCGWKDTIYDIYLQARQHRLESYNKKQTRPYFVSEYGDWEYHAMNAGFNQDTWSNLLPIERSSRQLRSSGEKQLLQQAYNVQEAHNDNYNTAAFGDGYWVMYDYNRGYAPDLESSGVMDIFRLPKFNYYFYKSQKDATIEPILFIANYWNEHSSNNVRIYSNCDEIALYLNNKFLSRKKADKNNISNNLPHPPFTFHLNKYTHGTLKAIGYINGKKIAEQTVSTPQSATKLEIALDISGKEPQKNCNDLLFVYIYIKDKNGTILPDYNEKINFTINGDAILLNPYQVIAEAGIATALIKIGDKGGKIVLNASKKELVSATYTFETK